MCHSLRQPHERQRSQHLSGFLVPDSRSLASVLQPPDPPAVVIADLCSERELLATRLSAASAQLQMAEDALIRSIASSILHEIKPIYSLSPPDLHFACSPSFYDNFTKGWESYQPAHHRSGYESYRRCTSLSQFLRLLPGWDLSREYSVSAEEVLTFHVSACPFHPIYAIYSPLYARMSLSFTPLTLYLPTSSLASTKALCASAFFSTAPPLNAPSGATRLP
jgi:hypothetical protein